MAAPPVTCGSGSKIFSSSLPLTTTTTMASTSNTAEAPATQPVVFTTQTQYPLPSQKFMIPSTWKRYQLSQLINKALSLEKPVPFDFLVRGEILRTTVAEWCSENGVGEVRPCSVSYRTARLTLSKEETLQIEYIESVMPPQKMSDFPQDDWVSSVSCSVPGYEPNGMCISEHADFCVDCFSPLHTTATSVPSIMARKWYCLQVYIPLQLPPCLLCHLRRTTPTQPTPSPPRPMTRRPT